MTTLYGSNAADQHQFLQRVTHLPMVALTLSHLTELYQQTKLRHDILTYALEKGEKTVWNGLDLASGIAQKTLPLNLVDTSACYMLSKLEEKLPIITYTPYEIKTSTRLLYDNNVQPRIDQLTEIKDNTMRMCADAKYYGSSKLSEAKSLGPVGLVKTMVPVDRVNQTVEWSLNAADSLVDKLLPEGESNLPSSGADGAGNLDHAKLLSNKLRQRIYSRIAENAQTAQLVAQAFHLVNSLKDSSAGHSVQHVLDEVRRLSGAVDLGEVSLHNVESHTLVLVKSLTTQLKDKLEASRQHLTEYLPTGAQDRLHQATDAAKDIFHQVREARNLDDLSQTLVGQVNLVSGNVQSTLSYVLDILTETYLLKWLIPEYQNIGSLDLHMHG